MLWNLALKSVPKVKIFPSMINLLCETQEAFASISLGFWWTGVVWGTFVIPNCLARGMCVGRNVAVKTKGQYAYDMCMQYTPLHQAS